MAATVDVDAGQRVVRVPGQPERQQVVGDAAQRRDALDVADETAVAAWHRLARLEQAVHRDLDMAELAGHSCRASDHRPASITPPPRPVPTIAETDERSDASSPKCRSMGVQGSSVAVVVVDHRKLQTFLDGCRGSRSPTTRRPAKFVEPRAEITPSALAGPGVSSPTARTAARAVAVTPSTSSIASSIAAIAAGRPVEHAARHLDHVIDEEPPVVVEHRGVGLRPPDIEPDHDAG